MKFNKILTLGAAMLLGASTLTSCLSNNDDEQTTTVQLTYASCFNSVRNMQTPDETDFYTGCKYTFTLKTAANGQSTLKIGMANIKLDNSLSLGAIELPELPVTIPTDITKPNTVSGRDIVPTNLVSSEIIFDYINVKFLLRYLENGQQSFVYTVEYSVNGKYQVVAFPTSAYYYAMTVSAPGDGATPFTSSDPRYTYTFNPDKKTANIEITGAKFIDDMPAMNMSFTEIPFEVSGSSLSLNAESLTPQIKGVPYPNFPITNLRSTVTPNAEGSLNFTCTPMGMGVFNVGVQLHDILTKENAGVQ